MTTPDPEPEEENLPDKDDIKSWLRKHEIDRFWLAERCGVTKRTVDNWLSTPRTIPPKARLIISGLIHTLQPVPEEVVLQNLVLEIDVDTFDRWSLTALECGMTVKEWAIDVLDQAARSYPVEMPEPVLKVAEPTDEEAHTVMPPDGEPAQEKDLPPGGDPPQGEDPPPQP